MFKILSFMLFIFYHNKNNFKKQIEKNRQMCEGQELLSFPSYMQILINDTISKAEKEKLKFYV